MRCTVCWMSVVKVFVNNDTTNEEKANTTILVDTIDIHYLGPHDFPDADPDFPDFDGPDEFDNYVNGLKRLEVETAVRVSTPVYQ